MMIDGEILKIPSHKTTIYFNKFFTIDSIRFWNFFPLLIKALNRCKHENVDSKAFSTLLHRLSGSTPAVSGDTRADNSATGELLVYQKRGTLGFNHLSQGHQQLAKTAQVFDQVWYQALLLKLPVYGLLRCLCIINHTSFYLTERLQTYHLLQESMDINAAVPQGCVLIIDAVHNMSTICYLLVVLIATYMRAARMHPI